MQKRAYKEILKWFLRAFSVMFCVVMVSLIVMMVAEFKPKPIEEIEIEGDSAGRSVREGERIEILSFNIGYGGLDASMDSFLDGGKMNTPGSREQVEKNLQGIIDVISSQSFDVLFLQEVDRDSRRSYHIDEHELLKMELGGCVMFAQDLRCLYVPFPVMDMVGMLNSGIQTHTDLKIRSSERISLPTSYVWPERLVQAKRCMLVTRIPIENSGRELVLINVHLDAYDDGRGKAAQSQVIAEFMKNEYELGNYVIAGGDLNHVFPDDDYSAYPIRTTEYFVPGKLDRGFFGEDWTFASDISAPTCRLLDVPYLSKRWWTQFYVIDGFIISPNVRLDRVETINADFEYSDHNPVKLTAILDD